MLTKKDIEKIVAAQKEFFYTKSQVYSKDDWDQKFKETEKKIEGIEQRFEGIEQRLEGTDEKFLEVGKRFDGIEQKLSKLQNTVDAIALDNKNAGENFIVQNYRIERVENWAGKAGAKISVKFER